MRVGRRFVEQVRQDVERLEDRAVVHAGRTLALNAGRSAISRAAAAGRPRSERITRP